MPDSQFGWVVGILRYTFHLSKPITMTKRLLIVAILFITKIASAQTTAWIKQLNEEENFLTAGSSRYYTVSKTAYASTTYTVRQFNSSGTALLATTISPGSPFTSMNVVKILATPNNELYILAFGNYGSFGNTREGLLIKLSSSLLQLWVRPLPAGFNYSYPTPIDMAVKGSDIAVLMNSKTTAGNSSFELRAVSQSTGNITIPGQSGTIFNYLTPVSLSVDANQNVYVCGEITTNNAILLKYSTSFNQMWSKVYSMGGRTWFSSIATDVSGNCYVTGLGKTATGTTYKTIVRKYNSSGALQSSYSSANLVSSNYWPEVGPKIKITAAGELFVGNASSGVVQPRIYAYKFSTTNLATPVYAVTHVLPLSAWSFYMTGFEATQSGKLFFTGSNNGTANVNKNYVSAKIRANGTIEFTEVYNYGRCNAMIKAIPGSYPNDEFVTTGVISNVNMLIKYTGPGARMEEETEISTKPVITVYPNPATSTVTITNNLHAAHLQLFNSEGKVVLSQETQGTSEINIIDLPRGLYFVRVTDEKGETETQKLLLQ